MPDRNQDTCEVRRLWPSDRQAVQAHFLRLDPETRANRFMAAISDRVALAYAERSFANDGLMYGAFVGGVLRGIGELRPAGSRPFGVRLGPQAEAAFTVEREFRRSGIGGTLFRRIADAASNRGVRDLHVRCLADNAPMQRLATRLGAELRFAGPETDGAIRLASPTPLSLWYEGIAEAFDLHRANATVPAPLVTGSVRLA